MFWDIGSESVVVRGECDIQYALGVIFCAHSRRLSLSLVVLAMALPHLVVLISVNHIYGLYLLFGYF